MYRQIPDIRENLEECVILEGRKHGDYSYPDLLVSIHAKGYSNYAREVRGALFQNNSFVLTIRQFVDFMNLLMGDRNGIYNGVGRRISKTRFNSMLDDARMFLLCANPTYNIELLDAEFDFFSHKGQFYITYNKINSDGTFKRIAEPLENSLIENRPSWKTIRSGSSSRLEGFSLNNWLKKATPQGFPYKKIPKGDIWYFGPVGGCFGYWSMRHSRPVGLGCDGNLGREVGGLCARVVRVKE